MFFTILTSDDMRKIRDRSPVEWGQYIAAWELFQKMFDERVATVSANVVLNGVANGWEDGLNDDAERMG